MTPRWAASFTPTIAKPLTPSMIQEQRQLRDTTVTILQKAKPEKQLYLLHLIIHELGVKCWREQRECDITRTKTIYMRIQTVSQSSQIREYMKDTKDEATSSLSKANGYILRP